MKQDISYIINLVVEYDDQFAFKELFNRFSPGLLAFAKAIVKNKMIAEEVVEDVFVNLWKNRKLLHTIGNISYYLHTAAKNTAINHLNKEKRTFSLHIEDINEHYTCNYINAENKSITNSNLLEILTAIENLPPKCQLIFRLSKEDGLSHKEIANLLDISTKTVENQLTIALQKISDAIRASLPEFAYYLNKQK